MIWFLISLMIVAGLSYGGAFGALKIVSAYYDHHAGQAPREKISQSTPAEAPPQQPPAEDANNFKEKKEKKVAA